MSFDIFHFISKSYENKEKPRQKPWFLWCVAPKKISLKKLF